MTPHREATRRARVAHVAWLNACSAIRSVPPGVLVAATRRWDCVGDDARDVVAQALRACGANAGPDYAVSFVFGDETRSARDWMSDLHALWNEAARASTYVLLVQWE